MDQERPPVEACSNPPDLDDIDLIAAIDDEASPDIQEHLAHCKACSERAQKLADLQLLLRQRLYRAFCLSTEELAAFQTSKMMASEAARARAHLAECIRCREELQLLASITTAPLTTIPASLQRQVVAAPLKRVDVLTEAKVYRVGGVRITLNIESKHGRDGPRLFGSLKGSASRGITASLLSQGRVVNSTALDEHGEFMLDHIDPGNFCLSLRLPDYEIIVEALHFT